jgi:hypothetical protein
VPLDGRTVLQLVGVALRTLGQTQVLDLWQPALEVVLRRDLAAAHAVSHDLDLVESLELEFNQSVEQ